MLLNSSIAEWIASLPESERATQLRELAPTEADQKALLYHWPYWARPKQQRPPGDWRVWLLLAGRGFGKTRTLVEELRDQVQHRGYRRQAIIGATAGDVRDILVEGESGILATSPPWFRPKYEPSKLRLVWPNGALSFLYSAEKPARLRGKQHDCGGCDELAAWKYLEETWAQLQFGLRLGNDPRLVVATTPRPLPMIRELMADSDTVTIRGTTYENYGHLSGAFLNTVLKRYEGTRLGRQELRAELLGDTPGALWTRALLDKAFVRRAPLLSKVVVAIDPSITDSEESDEAGIVVAGQGENEHGYVLEDRSGKMDATMWATAAIEAYVKWHANYIIAEVNQGGDLVRTVIEQTARTMRAEGKLDDRPIAFKTVHAKTGKRVRAEPIQALYQQGRIHHVGAHAKLEDQQCTWDATKPGKSPDRVDAAVYALMECCLGAELVRAEILPLRSRR